MIEAFDYDPERDIRNTADSVFCSHGAGVVIPWYEVTEHMHLPSVLREKRKGGDESLVDINRFRGSGEPERVLSIDEIDAILKRTYCANRRAGKTHGRDAGMSAASRYRDRLLSPDIPDSISPKADRGTGRAGEGEPLRGREGASSDRYSAARRHKTEKKPEYLLADGYNVIFSWEDLAELAKININSAREALLDILCNYQGLKGMELIAVFDAYRVEGHKTEYLDYHNIHVVYTAEAQTADSYIEHFAHENASHFDVTVVTSDGVEQVIVRGAGCRLMSSRDFRDEVIRTSRAASEEYLEEPEPSINSMKERLRDIDLSDRRVDIKVNWVSRHIA